MKVILHVDLNACFATVEQILDPSTAGKPLVVAHEIGRGVVSTASYEARDLGIHAGMPVFKVREIMRKTGVEVLFRSSGYDNYTRYAAIFFNFLARNYTPLIEVASIDECYIDATDIWKDFGSAEKLAEDIIENLYRETQLKCSVGVSETKFLSKMASDMKKPMGCTILRKEDLEDKLWPLDIKKYYGIGKKTAPKLREIGINKIGDIVKSMGKESLINVLGKTWLQYVLQATGESTGELNYEHNDLKSVGNSVTFRRDLTTHLEIMEFLKDLTKHVSKRSVKKDLVGKTISITMKYYDFRVTNRQMKLDDYTNDYNILISKVKRLFDENWEGKPLRLCGVSLGTIKNVYDISKQLSIFDNDPNDMLTEIERIINKTNAELGETSLMTLERYDAIKDKKYQAKYLEKDETTWRLHNQ